MIETNVYDESNNRKRTKIDYTDYNSIRDIYEYLNATDVYRHANIEYIRGAAYIDNKNRRMTSLVKSQSIYDGNGNIQSKVSYEHDLGGGYLISQGPPIRHDSTKYGVSFNQGRGNVNIVRKWDITDSNNQEKSLVSYIGYNTSGSVIFAKDGLGHQTQIKYDDFFSDSINRNTLAFPTKLIDPDSYESSIQYNYDLGLTTKSRNPKGAEIENTFDLIGRLERTTNKVNGAYTRYVYSSNQTSIQSFTTIKDLDLASEYFQITLLDGHGRTRAAASTHPTSIGGMKAQLFVFDQIGRQIRQTNPTEIDTSWNSTGDDVAGFLWTSQAYDWKGRPVESINVDGTKRLISYETCGCTGVNTISYTDEVGRRRKEYYDVFGRLSKSQALNSDGSIYTTTSNIYNLLDQNLRVFIQEGEAGIGRETLMTYDGFGRLATRKHPIEAAPTSFTYNADDTMNTITDARGVVTTFSYNNRKLVTSINYGAVNGVIQLKPVTFGYDEVGNRSWMDDEPGRVDYHYNLLSQMEWEERRFDDLSGIYRLNYQYNVGGQLTEITDFLNDTIYYNYNKAGEVLSITGKDQVSGSQYYYTSLANNATVKYTAWGGIKQFTHGNNIKTSFEYNERMLPKNFEITEHTNPPSYYDQGMRNTYSYYADGNIKFSKDEIHNDYDKSYEYDHLGRVSKASAGEVARGGTHSPYPPYDTPYSHSFIYNVWGNKETVNAFYWNYSDNESSQFDNVTGRKSLWVYDDAGHLMQDDDQKYLYNSSGNNQEIRKRWTNTLIKKGVQDGDGASVIYSSVNDDNAVKLSYYLTSTALGGKLLLKLDGQGQKTEEFIYLGNNRIATLFVVQAHGKVVSWEHQNPVSGDLGISFSDGKYRTESTLDPMGVDLMSAYPFVEPPTGESDPNYLSYFPEYKGRNGQPLKCYLDGINLPCYSIMESSGESQIAAPSSTTLGVYKKKTGEFLGYARWDGNPANSEGHYAYKLGFNFDFVPKGNRSEYVEGDSLFSNRYSPETHFINVVSGEPVGWGFQQSKKSQTVQTNKGPKPKTDNEWLADCYQINLYAYLTATAELGNTKRGKLGEALKIFSVTNWAGLLTFTTGAAAQKAADKGVRTAVMIGNTPAIGPKIGRMASILSGGTKALFNVGTKLVGTGAIVVSGAGTVIQAFDVAAGPESFLRDSINDCNKQNSQATGQVSIGALSQMWGTSYVNDIALYILSNQRK